MKAQSILENSRKWLHVMRGLLSYRSTGTTAPEVSSTIIGMHCDTNGHSTERISGWFRTWNPPQSKVEPTTSVLRERNAQEILEIANSLKEKGYYLFSEKLPEDFVDDIAAWARTEPARPDGLRDKLAVYDPKSPLSAAYRFDESASARQNSIQKMMAEPVFRKIAAQYLGANPVLSAVTCWWSAAMGGKASNESAQMYHFDLPNPSWLNFFVYLTDVDDESGPHCMIEGTHLPTPGRGKLLKRGYVRIPDEDIRDTFGAEKEIKILGKKGTMIIVDTKAFHKGKPPLSKDRLMLLLVYASTLFGGDYPAVPLDQSEMDSSLAEAVKSNPKTYSRFLNRRQ